ncbi:MAG: ExeM/NucH family extracellular endonuclease, partial [Nocardioidaceae bacterium]
GNGDPFSLQNRFRGGDTVTGITGVVDQSFGLYRLQPTEYGEYAARNTRPTSAPDTGGDIEVASFNVLNYFLTLDQGDNLCGPERSVECRGADNAEELQRQRAKIVSALAELDADVVGLMEMENTTGVEPAADLAAGLNDALGDGTYDYVDTGVVGSDAIRVGFLYKPGAVRPAGDFTVLDSTDDPRFDDQKNRPMVTQTFDEVATGARLTVSVNHLKSKGSACDDVGDPDTGDGQGNCNVTRTKAAEAVADFLAGDPTGSGDPDQLVIGDLNSYDHEDPIRALRDGGFEDQIRRYGGEQAYGYVFDGQAGYLDHALADTSLTGQVTGAAEWHVNADEPDILDYDTSFKPDPVDAIYAPDMYRSSDHDAVLVGLDPDRVTAQRCYADGSQSVASYSPGARDNGAALPPATTDAAQSLALSDPDDDSPYWASLGMGGELVQEFDRPVQNNNGDRPDLRVVDADDGAKGRADAAMVTASRDGSTWVDVGSVTGTGIVDLGSMPAARYVRVVDSTGDGALSASDGYDLDAVEVLTGCA